MQLPKWLTSARLGVILMITGAVLSGGAMLADVIGVGRNPQIYGYHQFIGTATGFLMIVIGMAVYLIDKEQIDV